MCLRDPESYAGWSFLLLVGPPKPDRSMDRDQTKSSLLGVAETKIFVAEPKGVFFWASSENGRVGRR